MTRHIRKHFDVAIANSLKKEEEQCVSILPSGKKEFIFNSK